MPRLSKFAVHLVYYWLLDRVTDPHGLRHYMNTARSLRYLVRDILLSREYRGRHLISRQTAVESLFEKLLRRRPDQQSLDRWMRDLGEQAVPDTAVWTTVVDDFMNLEECARFLRLFDIRYDAFFSHAHADGTHLRVMELGQLAQSTDYNFFLDELCLEPADEFSQIFPEAITNSDKFVIFVNQAYLRSLTDPLSWVSSEYRVAIAARSNGLRIIMVNLDEGFPVLAPSHPFIVDGLGPSHLQWILTRTRTGAETRTMTPQEILTQIREIRA
jgi:hypothetical protein